MIAILDYGAGNLRSVETGFARAGVCISGAWILFLRNCSGKCFLGSALLKSNSRLQNKNGARIIAPFGVRIAYCAFECKIYTSFAPSPDAHVKTIGLRPNFFS